VFYSPQPPEGRKSGGATGTDTRYDRQADAFMGSVRLGCILILMREVVMRQAQRSFEEDRMSENPPPNDDEKRGEDMPDSVLPC